MKEEGTYTGKGKERDEGRRGMKEEVKNKLEGREMG